MHRSVEILIGRLVTDPGLRRRFASRPEAALREQGLELTELELAALAATHVEAFGALAAALDGRLRRAGRSPTRSDDRRPFPTPIPGVPPCDP